MSEHASNSIIINAPPERCFRVACDFEHYPLWARDLKETEIVEVGDDGLARSVRFRAAAMGRSARYTLDYDYSDAPASLKWTLREGDIMKVLDGVYRFEALESGSTLITYDLEVELILPLPAFVKRRAESKIIGFALDGMKAYIESGRAG